MLKGFLLVHHCSHSNWSLLGFLEVALVTSTDIASVEVSSRLAPSHSSSPKATVELLLLALLN